MLLALPVCPIDREAAAYTVSENITLNITLERRGTSTRYILTEDVHRIIKIVRTSALKEANIHLVYPKNDADDYIYKLAASTYNLAGDDISEQKLNKTDFYKKDIGSGFTDLYFTFPGAKEGSVIEYSFSHVHSLQTILPRWDIQNEYPKLQTTCTINSPKNFLFTSVSHVAVAQKEYTSMESAKDGTDSLAHSSEQLFDEMRYFWIRRNVPALNDEPYVNNYLNYKENLALHITTVIQGGTMKNLNNTWEKINDDILKEDAFRKILTANNGFLDDVVDSLVHLKNDLATYNIYNYVRTNITCDEDASLRPRRILSEVWKNKRGTNADINMFLCAMLVHAGIDACPILLSTSGHMSPTAAFPLIERFNYLACAVKNEERFTLLDASNKYNNYGVLPLRCYNGFAWVVRQGGGAGIMLDCDALDDRHVIGIKLTNVTDSGAAIEMTQKIGFLRSAYLRRSWHADAKKKQEFIDGQIRDMPGSISISDTKVLEEENADTNLVIVSIGNITFARDSGLSFIATYLLKNSSKNPFTAAVRKMPVEFPYKLQERYVLTIDIPDGLEPVNLPPPAMLALEDGGLAYEKSATYFPAMHLLTINSIYRRTTTSYPPEAYDAIRNFYQQVTAKENEIITIKRK